MTSQLNLEDIYTELNNLLKDVCSFLTSEAQNGTLSAKAKNEAEKLVSRSRQQVDIVTKLSVIQESTNSNYPYLEMQGPPGGPEEPLSEYVPAEITDYYEPELYEESYAPVDNEPISTPPPTPTFNGDYCLYDDLPLNMIEEKSVKYGPLCRKERYLFLEQKKQYMAGLVGYWLLIYSINKKDQKPLQTMNLLNYSARSIEQRKDPVFEIYAENEKTYEFIARSIKDMEQWIVAINCKKHMCTNGRNLPELPVATRSQNFNNSNRNSNQTNSDNEIVMHYGSEEDIYASVEDFGKHEIPKPIIPPTVEEFPKLPPRVIKDKSPPKNPSTTDNTYNNLHKIETEANDADDIHSEYDFVQCSDIDKQQNNEEELEIYDEFLNVTETLNKNVKKPLFTPHDNYDSVDTGEEELEDYDTIKPMPVKINIPPNVQENDDEEEMVDYDELKPITLPNKLRQTFIETQLQKDEDLDDYDELKPMKPTAQATSKEEVLVHSTTAKEEEEEELPDYDILKPILQKNSTIPPNYDDDELVDYDELKSIPNVKPSPNIMKKIENNNETKSAKPTKPMKKFWEKRSSSESPKKEIDPEDEHKLSVANIKSKLNAQLLLTPQQDKNKPPITSPKPKSQTLLNKFPSFSKNRNSKDEDGNSKVQNIRQQLEHTFRNHKN